MVVKGQSRMAQIAETLGATVMIFSRETGWDFDQLAHQRAFPDLAGEGDP